MQNCLSFMGKIVKINNERLGRRWNVRCTDPSTMYSELNIMALFFYIAGCAPLPLYPFIDVTTGSNVYDNNSGRVIVKCQTGYRFETGDVEVPLTCTHGMWSRPPHCLSKEPFCLYNSRLQYAVL